jgi:hypothetical protein
MTIKQTFKNPAIIGLIYGLIGGIALVVVFDTTKIIYLQIMPYPLIVIISIITIALLDKSAITLKRLFITGITAYLLMSIIFYLYLTTSINPNSNITIVGHLWRWAIIVGIGIASVILTSFIVRIFKK